MHELDRRQQAQFLRERKYAALDEWQKFILANQNKATATDPMQKKWRSIRDNIKSLPESGSISHIESRFSALNDSLDMTPFHADTSIEDAAVAVKNSFFGPVVPEHTPFTAQKRVENTMKTANAFVDPYGTARGRGRFRSAVIPTVTGLAASYTTKQLNALHINDHRPVTNAVRAIFNVGGGVWSTGIATLGLSLGASTALRFIKKHNNLDMFARNSHTGGLSKDTKKKMKIPTFGSHGHGHGPNPLVSLINLPINIVNKVVEPVVNVPLKVGRLAERGVERAALKRMFGIGETDKTNALVDYADGKITVDSWSHRKKLKYAKEGVRFLREGNALKSKNAYFTKKEDAYWKENENKVKKAVVSVTESIPNRDHQNDMLLTIDKHLNSQLRNAAKYWTGALLLAGIGAMKAMLIDSVSNTKDGLRLTFEKSGNLLGKLGYFLNHPVNRKLIYKVSRTF